MEAGERQVILIVADISWYTRFMVANQTALSHAQVIITELIQAIIKEVEIPLQVAKLEGDAVFLYAIKDTSAADWAKVREQIGQKLIGFFGVFGEKVAELSQSNTCKCDACEHVEALRLKTVVHSGQALFYEVGGFSELSGVDVILVHRLLKNSVHADEYVMLTEDAYRDVAFPPQIEVVEGQESYDSIGTIKTYVYYPPADKMIFLDMDDMPRYDTRRYRIKNMALKMLNAMLYRLGIKPLPEYEHLPKSPF